MISDVSGGTTTTLVGCAIGVGTTGAVVVVGATGLAVVVVVVVGVAGAEVVVVVVVVGEADEVEDVVDVVEVVEVVDEEEPPPPEVEALQIVVLGFTDTVSVVWPAAKAIPSDEDELPHVSSTVALLLV